MLLAGWTNNRGLAISRNLLLFLIFIGFVLFGLFWGIPAARARLFGASLQIRVEVLSMEEDNNVSVPGSTDTVSRNVVTLKVFFPMGSAPENATELIVWDDNDQAVDVAWGQLERDDQEDKGVTQWTIRESFFPTNFKQGRLRNRVRDLCPIRLTGVSAPVESTPAPAPQ